ncbi:hypothetical protein SPSYN_02512 [Sporotomaculum syntrophicum]|uniref:DUF4405 domain-containing protein n=1 Tax=Sporotomaculum syntrophicum TaxID=182264 RepID=A0A9D2WPU8_9FIRM|nr:hypothetical protein SPSYN_02512 [Sporotomaculum syntrophicum]
MLDVGLAALFLILIEPQRTGMAWHEILGLSIGFLFTMHVLLNWSWVKKTTRNLFTLAYKTKTKLCYVLNTVSFICVITIYGREFYGRELKSRGCCLSRIQRI